MAKILRRCKICRRLGQKLFLKGERCYSQKCAMIKRPYAPGLHGKTTRRMLSEYGRQLREKQKVRHTYGLSESQFKKYVQEAAQERGDKGQILLQRLEHRLDNVVYRLGWAPSRRAARQIVNHGHILVNGEKVNIPSYEVEKGDVIKLKEKSQKSKMFEHLPTILKKYQTPSWLSLDKKKLEGKVIGEPTPEDIGQVADTAAVIEFYSR